MFPKVENLQKGVVKGVVILHLPKIPLLHPTPLVSDLSLKKKKAKYGYFLILSSFLCKRYLSILYTIVLCFFHLIIYQFIEIFLILFYSYVSLHSVDVP